MTQFETALICMLRAHDGQKRIGGDIPFASHPISVAYKLVPYQFSEEVLAAALLHDVVEDTAVSESDIRTLMGDTIADMVAALTENKALAWEERKRRYIDAVRSASDEVRAIATADKIHNLESIRDLYTVHGQETWSLFRVGREKKLRFEDEMLQMLKETWLHPLVAEYERVLSVVKALEYPLA